MKRRSMLRALFVLASGTALSTPGLALAEQYPARPIRLVVPWPPGGVADVVGRLIGDRLAQELGQSVVVENKPGANGFIGTEAVAKAAPDGYTLLLVTASTHSVAPNLYRKLPYDAIKDFAPVSQVTSAPTIMVTPADSPFASLPALVAWAKSNPGKLNYATYGAGGSSQLAAELFMQAAGIQMTAIPYKGATPAIMGLMSGDVGLFFDSIPSALPHVRNGKLKALAVTGAQRTPAMPDLPTVAETFPGFEFTVWQGIEAPARTPRAAVDKLAAAINRIISLPEVRNRLRDLGADAVASPTPEQFGQHVLRQKEKFAELIKRANIALLD